MRTVIGQETPPDDDPATDRGNTAKNNGGGIFVYRSAPQILGAENCRRCYGLLIRKNRAVLGAGGGIAIRSKSAQCSPLRRRMAGLLIEENEALEINGGGIAIFDEADNVSIEEVVVTKNAAGLHGGGLYTSTKSSSKIQQRSRNYREYHAKTGKGGGIAIEGENRERGRPYTRSKAR